MMIFFVIKKAKKVLCKYQLTKTPRTVGKDLSELEQYKNNYFIEYRLKKEYLNMKVVLGP
jgi:hypothetical protein